MKTAFDFSKVKKAGRAKSLNDMYAGGGTGDGDPIATRAVKSADVQYYPLKEDVNIFEAKDLNYPPGSKLAYSQNEKQKKKMLLRKHGMLMEANVPDGKGTFKKEMVPLPLDHIPDKYLTDENFFSESDPYGYRPKKLRSMEEKYIPTEEDKFIPNYSGTVKKETVPINNPKNYRELLRLLYKNI